MERTNARLLNPGDLPPGISFLAVDVSFISATLVLPSVLAALSGTPAVRAVLLIKPQFEAGRERVGKGGIVRDPAAHQFAVDRVRACVEQIGGTNIDTIDSPITGAEGNREFLLHAQWR
jgi:23S rRNA (cytidine1920-2'-O)/16S rRNA (cytidine1409-2'-O)-methyltransferase